MKKILVLYDLENQNNEKQELEEWKLPYNVLFSGYSIKDGAPSDAIENNTAAQKIDIIVILIGESTPFLSLTFKDDVQKIMDTELPIICLNLNGFVALEEQFCPKYLAHAAAVHMPFSKEDLLFTLQHLEEDFRKHNRTGSFHMKRNRPDNPFDY